LSPKAFRRSHVFCRQGGGDLLEVQVVGGADVHDTDVIGGKDLSCAVAARSAPIRCAER
jgi:hypothetical protein